MQARGIRCIPAAEAEVSYLFGEFRQDSLSVRMACLAGGMLGGVFNQLAFMVNDAAGPALGWLFCGLILIFGHTLNIAMSCLSAFVHPLRLTFVEYFKNSGYEGKGEAYKPFTVVKK